MQTGDTALTWACEKGLADVSMALLAKGADVNRVTQVREAAVVVMLRE
jgi:ankyrin repeat protein